MYCEIVFVRCKTVTRRLKAFCQENQTVLGTSLVLVKEENKMIVEESGLMVRSLEVIELDLGEASVLAVHEGHLQATEVELPDIYRGEGEGVSTEALLSQERGKKIGN